MKSFSRVSRVIAGIMTMLIVTGCSSATRENNNMEDAFNELMKGPNINAAGADYESMLRTIRQRLVTEVGVAPWIPGDEPVSESACSGARSNLDEAGIRYFEAEMSPGNLPDARWVQAVAIVSEVAKAHGFAPEASSVNPGSHRIEFRNAGGGQLRFANQASTILGGSTGCHLTEEAHNRGTYLPPKEY
jgi:Lipoprotein confined to pathogenic Mycobacterium